MLNERLLLDRTTAGSLDRWLEAAQNEGAIALIDKEEQWTSFDCVAKLRNLTRVRRVGHAGTLDPLATGLLVLCFGKATKDLATLQDDDKIYGVDILLGATSTTDDREGEIVEIPTQVIEEANIIQALMSFVGTIKQTPPAFSAVKHLGKRQYDLAREGKEFVPKTRTVTVLSITSVNVQWPHVTCTIHCTKGTYIRSVARDVGALLGCGGYVWALRRIKSGGFGVANALRVSEVQEMLLAKVPA